MGKVFFSVGMTLDGYMAPEGMELAHVNDPTYKDWLAQWLTLMHWVTEQRFFRENLKIGEGGETGADNDFLAATYARTGVSIMGKRMFEAGEGSWPEEAPFHTPVFVLTHEVRAPWARPGGTTFHFVNDGIDSALRQARAVAGDRDIRIAGGANASLQYLNAGLVDEFVISLAPVLFGGGTPLFAGIDRTKVGLEIAETIPSRGVTHIRYAVTKR